MKRRWGTTSALAAMALLAAAGCGDDAGDASTNPTIPSTTAPSANPNVDPSAEPTVLPRPAEWADVVDNPWYPLIPGTVFHLRGSEDGAKLRETLTATHRTKLIDGVKCTVLLDDLYEEGVLHERTTDWYAQDADGNVWYFGEDTVIFDKNGNVKTHEGSWESGVDGAQAGVFMPAEPMLGQAFQQEQYPNHAEDNFRVVELNATVAVPGVHSTKALRTEEFTPLEPKVLDNKWYVRGLGTVKEQTVKGGSESLELVSVDRP